MVSVTVEAGKVVFELLGLHKLWALKRRIVVPASHVVAVRVAPELPKFRFGDLRLPGTHVPGLITAGSYWQGGRWTFWDVAKRQRVIAVELAGEFYEELFLEVEDPDGVAQRLRAA